MPTSQMMIFTAAFSFEWMRAPLFPPRREHGYYFGVAGRLPPWPPGTPNTPAEPPRSAVSLSPPAPARTARLPRPAPAIAPAPGSRRRCLRHAARTAWGTRREDQRFRSFSRL
ncbi:hypothetical protein Cs7R123_21130 [Catellatospora sp. TT07R-123]|nr:hypothetical protein Cs7R123_21130 [Catellatospora sp. TT07R-123]